MFERGKIRNKANAQQIMDFSGLRFGNITPTDIDAFIEYKNKAMVLIESKYGESKLKGGQRLAFERLIDVIAKDRHAIGFVCSHTPELVDTEGGVDLSRAVVTEYRHKNKWVKSNGVTLFIAISKFFRFIEGKTKP